MTSDAERRYHETWLGMVQPIEGLVFSVPVLAESGVMQRCEPAVHEAFRAHLMALAAPSGNEGAPDEKHGHKSSAGKKASAKKDAEATADRVCVRDLPAFLREVLGYSDDQLLHVQPLDELPAAWCHYVPEGGQTLRPSVVVRAEPGSDAAPQLLVWQVPDGLDLDKPETVTGPWPYPPKNKFDRLLRATRIPVGLLVNGLEFRLVYAPHGESTGSLSFRVADMQSVGGRGIFDAFRSLLSAHRAFGGDADKTLRALLEQSRKRQADVTNALATQVFEALELLLQGFANAAERDGTQALREAMQADAERRGDGSGTGGDDDDGGTETVYGGLLTAMLRLVFLLYAEDRDLMPMGNAVYAKHLSVLGLFDQLQQDAGLYPDTMGRRYGAWPRLLALFRAVYEGIDARPDGAQDGGSDDGGGFFVPARRGQLFDPQVYPFLEGWSHGGSAPFSPEDRAQVRVPSIDDETLYRVLDKLLILDGQRLSYRALDVEQIGSVYEALMGYRVKRLISPAVCLKDSGVWLETARVLEQAPNRREAFVVDESALPKGKVGKLADALKAAKTDDDVLAALDGLRKNAKTVPVRPLGALVLQPGAERRRTSSHYTPRSLSAPIVEKTLRPLLATMAAGGREPTADELLELKICDPAMGSGAFLVEACRFLADEVVKAWTRQGILAGIESVHGDPVTHARRLVAQCCLYGVDKNPYAVTLAKLSLWLVSFAKDEPFTFVDHALRWGDSLVGLSLDQLRRFHWSDDDKHAQSDFVVDLVANQLDESMQYRQRILQAARRGQEDVRNKEHLLFEAEESAKDARLVADVVVGAFFAHDKDKDREHERTTRLTAVSQWVASGLSAPPQLKTWQAELRAQTPAFHWPIEFPEVFYAGRPDPLDAQHATKVAWMDAFVGNPPFMGGREITTNLGSRYSGFLLASEREVVGSADLVAHFFRRLYKLLGHSGILGLIATNTISQGATRTSGLQFIVNNGGRIFAATKSTAWPGTASVSVSTVHIARGTASTCALPNELDGFEVESIDSRLEAKAERGDPCPLAANENQSFQGIIPHGLGFTVDSDEYTRLMVSDPRNGERIRKLIGGDEVNSSPTHESGRFVIDFENMSEREARSWPTLFALVEERVKPERLLKNASLYPKLVEEWWKFGHQASEMRRAISGNRSSLVLSIVSTHLSIARIRNA